MKIKFSKFLLAFYLLFSQLIWAQNDLFDSTHSVQYADYLYNTQNYSASKLEFSRLNFIDKQNLIYQVKMLESFRLDGDLKGGLLAGKNLYSSDSLFPKPASESYLHLLFLSEYRYRTAVFLESNPSFNLGQKAFYQSANLVLDRKFSEAQTLLNTYKSDTNNLSINALNSILENHQAFKPRSKALAFSMATLVPGTGKMYLGQWKDGLAALVYTSLSAWQSQRGFDKKGIKSIYGWGFGAVAAGFYFGNIYGTMKSLRIRRENNNLKAIEQTQLLVESTFK